MKTFYVQTLGCKVNQYESEQIAAVLRSRGLVEAGASHADLRVVNTCSVTTEAASKSRQASRRMVRLPVFTAAAGPAAPPAAGGHPAPGQSENGLTGLPQHPAVPSGGGSGGLGPARRPRVIVTGCWATSDRGAAAGLPGVDAVLTHHGDVAVELGALLERWRGEEQRGGRGDPEPTEGAEPGDTSRPQRRELHAPADSPIEPVGPHVESPPERLRNDGWINEAGLPADSRTAESKADSPEKVNLQIYALSVERGSENPKSDAAPRGTAGLPLLDARQSGRQRAFLKIQDGCDAHCTYCIIPRLRPTLWSKPVGDVVEEATRLVAAGHVEIVLTGVFLSAYGQQTALRRRRSPGANRGPLAELVGALCTRVAGLRRLRLSSLEPGDLTDDLLAALREHGQVVPHFHLPLQSGCDALLRRMNRQYNRDDYLRMLDRVRATFDRPALTSDVIVGFPGETDDAFDATMDVVDRAGFIHVHAFPYSARPGTAASRWTHAFVGGAVVNERIDALGRRAAAYDCAFRQQFVGEVVEVLVERDETHAGVAPPSRHGRSERYFDVHFDAAKAAPGDFVRVRVDEVTARRTHGTCIAVERPAGGAT